MDICAASLRRRICWPTSKCYVETLFQQPEVRNNYSRISHFDIAKRAKTKQPMECINAGEMIQVELGVKKNVFS